MPHLIGQRLGRPGFIRAGQRLQQRVGALGQQPTARTQRPGHRGQPGRVIVHMLQHQARVHQVKPASCGFLRAQVMPQHVDIDAAAGGQGPGIHIGRHHAAGLAGPLGQPARDSPVGFPS
jgi:hypothetical protein